MTTAPTETLKQIENRHAVLEQEKKYLNTINAAAKALDIDRDDLHNTYYYKKEELSKTFDNFRDKNNAKKLGYFTAAFMLAAGTTSIGIGLLAQIATPLLYSGTISIALTGNFLALAAMHSNAAQRTKRTITNDIDNHKKLLSHTPGT